MGQHQTCKQCGRPQRFEFSVSDEVWNRTTGGFPFALCIECWLEMADGRECSEPLSAGSFRFLGVIGERVSAVILDRE